MQSDSEKKNYLEDYSISLAKNQMIKASSIVIKAPPILPSSVTFL